MSKLSEHHPRPLLSGNLPGTHSPNQRSLAGMRRGLPSAASTLPDTVLLAPYDRVGGGLFQLSFKFQPVPDSPGYLT